MVVIVLQLFCRVFGVASSRCKALTMTSKALRVLRLTGGGQSDTQRASCIEEDGVIVAS